MTTQELLFVLEPPPRPFLSPIIDVGGRYLLGKIQNHIAVPLSEPEILDVIHKVRGYDELIAMTPIVYNETAHQTAVRLIKFGASPQQ